jgi:hypothetical protein
VYAVGRKIGLEMVKKSEILGFVKAVPSVCLPACLYYRTEKLGFCWTNFLEIL